MNRHRRRLLGFFLALTLGVTALSGGTWTIALWLARMDMERSVARMADEAIDRTDSVLGEAGDVLRDLHWIEPPFCTPEHVFKMREVAFDSAFIREAGFLAGEWLLCTGNGPKLPPILSNDPDWEDGEGYRVWFSVRTESSRRARSMVIQWANHNVLIDPSLFVDVRSDEPKSARISILTRSGRLLADIQRGTVNAGEMFEIERRSARFPIVARVATPVATATTKAADYWVAQGAVTLLLAAALGLLGWRAMRDSDTPEYRVRRLLERGTVDVAFQPIVRLADGHWVGCEALIRWPEHDTPVLRPDVFVPVAEKLGLIGRLTDLVVERSLAQLGEFLHQRPDFYLAVNLAAEDFNQPRIAPYLRDAVERYHLRPAQLRVEATERGFINPKAAIDVIRTLREAGHLVAIDDFGTGYSSLGLLHEVDVDVLKIDRMFVSTIDGGETGRGVIDHIIDMANSLGLATVAEGIETDAQRDYLMARGVGFGQGYLFSKPLSAYDLISARQHAG